MPSSEASLLSLCLSGLGFVGSAAANTSPGHFFTATIYLFIFKRNRNKQILAASKVMPQAAASGCMNLREGGD
jgi:hypothetical protein